MNETVLLRNQIAALTKERDEWMRSLEFSLKQRDKLTAERDALKDAVALWIRRSDKTWHEKHYTEQISALKDAARLALDALVESEPHPDDANYEDAVEAITALKAVL